VVQALGGVEIIIHDAIKAGVRHDVIADVRDAAVEVTDFSGARSSEGRGENRGADDQADLHGRVPSVFMYQCSAEFCSLRNVDSHSCSVPRGLNRAAKAATLSARCSGPLPSRWETAAAI